MERVVSLIKVKNDPIKCWSNNNGWGNYKGCAQCDLSKTKSINIIEVDFLIINVIEFFGINN